MLLSGIGWVWGLYWMRAPFLLQVTVRLHLHAPHMRLDGQMIGLKEEGERERKN